MRRAFLVLAFAFASGGAHADDPAWMMRDLLPAAQAEGQVTLYSSTNEQEGLPMWRMFEEATGVKVNYIRGAEAPLISRVMTEMRANQPTWDIMHSSAVTHMPPAFVAQFDPPEAKNLMPEARDPDRRWYGAYASYNAPQYNAELIAKADLPTSYEDFATKKQWAGRVAIDQGDREWLMGMLAYYGEERGKKIVGDLIANLKPVIVDGHLAMARAVSAGEYLISLTNYTMLVTNMQQSGAKTDIWPLDPVSLFISQTGVNAKAPHPNAARLALNFLISQQAQAFAAKTGRLPTRDDVEPNPPDALKRLRAKKVETILLNAETARAAQKLFDQMFKGR